MEPFDWSMFTIILETMTGRKRRNPRMVGVH